MDSRKAIKIILGLIVGIVIFHLSIILKITPYDIAWGGKLNSDSEMYVFESISILVLLLLGWILLMRGEFIKSILPKKWINIALWIFLILFALNTFGNLFAATSFEKSFAALTLTLSTLLGIILLRKPSSDD